MTTITLPTPKHETADEVVLDRGDWNALAAALTAVRNALDELAEEEADRLALAEGRAEQAAYEAALPPGREATTPLAVFMAEIAGTHRLRAWREHRGLTQQALAAAANVTRDMIAQIETGKRQGSIDTLGRLAAALGVPIDALVESE